MFVVTRAFLRHYRQLAVVGTLLLASALCFAMLLARVLYTHRLGYVGLGWNLVLAWLPMLSALGAYNLYKRHSRLSWLAVAGCAGVWLLFFPNAPYLVTDVIHLQASAGVPYWYDLLLIVTFAWTGFLLGLVSLYLMQALVRRAAGGPASWLFVFIVIGLCGFGIYLGRFLRWNSWDLIFSPAALLADILVRLRHPWEHLRTFVFSALFALFFISAYLVLVAVAHFRLEAAPERDRR